MDGIPIDAQITFLYVSDLQRSVAFYEGVLGLTLVVDQGSCRIYGVVGSQGYLGICERGSAAENRDTLIFTLVTPDVDGWYQQIRARGWDCESAPVVSEQYNIYHFFLRDPDGYKLEVQRFLDAGWNKTT